MYEPYLTASDFQSDSLGVDLTGVSDAEIAGMLRRASLMVDRYCRRSFQWTYTPDEAQDWPMTDARPQPYGEIYPYKGPVRTVQSFTIEVGVNTDGTPAYANVPTTPTGPGPLGDLPPHTTGQVWLDRRRGIVQPVYILLQFGIFAALPSLGIRPPAVNLGYTSGYDRGTGPTSAPSVGAGTSGSGVDPGLHAWAMSYTTVDGESLIGPVATGTVLDGAGHVPLSRLPLGSTIRTLYRSCAETTFPLYAVTTIDDNTTTTYVDTTADDELGAMARGEGYSLPLPYELLEATRITAAMLAGDRQLNAIGMMAAEQWRIEDTQIRRRTTKAGSPDTTIPELAKDLLKQFRALSIA